MARAGYNPNEAIAVWEKMSALGGSGTPEIMSTHPSNENRIKDLTEISKKVYPLYESAVFTVFTITPVSISIFSR